METATIGGCLELRARGDRDTIRGTFPYNQTATRADRGKVRKERFGPEAFKWRLDEWRKLEERAAKALAENISRAQQLIIEEQLQRGNIHILSGHDFNKPLGDLKAGNTRIWDNPTALHFETVLPDPELRPSWMVDTVKAIRSDLAGGLSPGFRIPPKDVVAEAERLIAEPGNPAVLIRHIVEANLFEMSVVTRPHYPSDIDIRGEYLEPAGTVPGRRWWQ